MPALVSVVGETLLTSTAESSPCPSLCAGRIEAVCSARRFGYVLVLDRGGWREGGGRGTRHHGRVDGAADPNFGTGADATAPVTARATSDGQKLLWGALGALIVPGHILDHEAFMSQDGPSDTMRVEVVVEVPKGSRNKYEIDHENGQIWLDRLLFTATRYPADYGFLPHTLGEDTDPLDAMVLGDEPVYPGVHVWARPVAAFLMRDEAGPDAKILCVHADDERWSHLRGLGDLPVHLKAEIHHFFQVYKALEPGKDAEVGEWVDLPEAQQLIREARMRHRQPS